MDPNETVSVVNEQVKTKWVETKTESFTFTVILLNDSAETAVKK